MLTIIVLIINLFILCLSDVIYPPEVCIIGDTQADYDSQRDPRTLMGTYTEIDYTGLTFDEKIVDTSAPIYEHVYSANNTADQGNQQYLFKVKEIGSDGNQFGWSLSETLPLDGETMTIFLTCFQDSLFDCKYTKWFWGYNKYEYAIPTLKVLGGECASFVPIYLYIDLFFFLRDKC